MTRIVRWVFVVPAIVSGFGLAMPLAILLKNSVVTEEAGFGGNFSIFLTFFSLIGAPLGNLIWSINRPGETEDGGSSDHDFVSNSVLVERLWHERATSTASNNP